MCRAIKDGLPIHVLGCGALPTSVVLLKLGDACAGAKNVMLRWAPHSCVLGVVAVCDIMHRQCICGANVYLAARDNALLGNWCVCVCVLELWC